MVALTPWINDDGLRVRFGLDKSKDALVGVPLQSGSRKTITAEIRSSRLPVYAAAASGGDVLDGTFVAIPAGVLIEDAILRVTTPFESANNTAALTVGTVQADLTEIDYNGLIDAQIETGMDAVGDLVTGAGADIDTITTVAGYLWVAVTDASNVDSFTAGEGVLEITYLIPPAGA